MAVVVVVVNIVLEYRKYELEIASLYAMRTNVSNEEQTEQECDDEDTTRIRANLPGIYIQTSFGCANSTQNLTWWWPGEGAVYPGKQ